MLKLNKYSQKALGDLGDEISKGQDALRRIEIHFGTLEGLLVSMDANYQVVVTGKPPEDFLTKRHRANDDQEQEGGGDV